MPVNGLADWSGSRSDLSVFICPLLMFVQIIENGERDRRKCEPGEGIAISPVEAVAPIPMAIRPNDHSVAVKAGTVWSRVDPAISDDRVPVFPVVFPPFSMISSRISVDTWALLLVPRSGLYSRAIFSIFLCLIAASLAMLRPHFAMLAARSDTLVLVILSCLLVTLPPVMLG
jgi:hypothetical protein